MHVYRSMIIDADIETVWSAVRAFDGLAAWNPGVEKAVLESGAGTEVGTVRSLDIGSDAVFRETLLAHSDLEHSYTYNIVESPLPVTSYVSTHRFIPITHTGQTLGIWESWFDCPADQAEDMAKTVGDQIYIGGMQGLNDYLKEQLNG